MASEATVERLGSGLAEGGSCLVSLSTMEAEKDALSHVEGIKREHGVTVGFGFTLK